MLKVAKQTLAVNNPEATQLKHSFVHFTDKADDDFMKPIFERIASRVQQAGWHYQEVSFEHWPILDKPQEVAQLLLGFD